MIDAEPSETSAHGEDRAGHDRRDTLWETLGAVEGEERWDARLQLHHAVQLLASFGQARVPAREDDSHRSMRWDPAAGAFRSEEDPAGVSLALRVRELALELRRGDGAATSPFQLQDRRLSEARAWLGRKLGEVLDEQPRVMAWPEYEIPPHPVGESDPFRLEPPALDELARWYDDTHHLLAPLVEAEERASPLRCWPHHFDLATLLTLDPEAEPEEARAIGVGMTPGDESYAEPYWYVNPWPRPDDDVELSELEGPGHWHREGWVGAVLTASELVEGPDREQEDRARRYLEEGLAVCRDILG